MSGAVYGLDGQAGRDEVSLVTFSPDSQIIAAAAKDKAVRLWCVKTGLALLSSPHFDKLLLAFYRPGIFVERDDGGSGVVYPDFNCGKRQLGRLSRQWANVKKMRLTRLPKPIFIHFGLNTDPILLVIRD